MAESLEKLQNRILSDAKAKADEINREAQTKADQVLADAKQRGQKEHDEILARANLEAEAIRRSILSSKVRANRLKILDTKNRIVEEVVRAVESQLSNLASSNKFDAATKRFAAEAVKAVDSERPVVRLGFSEVSKKDLDGVAKALPKDSKLVFEDNPIDELGGVVASDAEGKITFNNSFKSRLERLDSQLLTLISATIFGE